MGYCDWQHTAWIEYEIKTDSWFGPDVGPEGRVARFHRVSILHSAGPMQEGAGEWNEKPEAQEHHIPPGATHPQLWQEGILQEKAGKGTAAMLLMLPSQPAQLQDLNYRFR